MGRWWGRGRSPQADVKTVSREAESDSGWRGLAPIEPTRRLVRADCSTSRVQVDTHHRAQSRTDGTASSDVHLAWRPALRDEVDQRTCPREPTSPSRAPVRPAFTAMVAKTSGPTHTGGFRTDARSACAGTVRAVRTQRRHRIWLRLRCFHHLAGTRSRSARTAGGAGGERHKRRTSDRVGPIGRLELRLRCFHQLAGTCSRPARTAGGAGGDFHKRATSDRVGPIGRLELRLRCFHQLAGTRSRPARTAGGAGGATSDRVAQPTRLRLRCFHQLAGTRSRPARTAGGAVELPQASYQRPRRPTSLAPAPMLSPARRYMQPTRTYSGRCRWRLPQASYQRPRRPNRSTRAPAPMLSPARRYMQPTRTYSGRCRWTASQASYQRPRRPNRSTHLMPDSRRLSSRRRQAKLSRPQLLPPRSQQ